MGEKKFDGLGFNLSYSYLLVFFFSHSDAWRPQNTAPLPPNIPMASVQQVEAAAAAIRAGKKPVIVLGSQATLPPVSADKLRSTLEGLGIPCFLAGMCRGTSGHGRV